MSLDDAYSAPKAVEATRRLAEQDEVLALFGSLGTAPQSAVQKFLNSKKIPQLLLNTGASRWNNPKEFKWTTPGLPIYSTEGRIIAALPDAGQAERQGRDPLPERRVRKGLHEFVQGDSGRSGRLREGDRRGVSTTSPIRPSIRQLINLAKSGADTFFNISTGKATSQSIRKVAELGWKPLHLLVSTSSGRSIINAAGAENAKGIVAMTYTKEVGSEKWKRRSGRDRLPGAAQEVSA